MKHLLAVALLMSTMTVQAESKTFVALHTGGYLLGLADSSATARWDAEELNPLAPQNTALRTLEVTGSWAAMTWFDHHLRAHGHKWWWVAPVLGIAGHGYGISTGLRHDLQ